MAVNLNPAHIRLPQQVPINALRDDYLEPCLQRFESIQTGRNEKKTKRDIIIATNAVYLFKYPTNNGAREKEKESKTLESKKV